MARESFEFHASRHTTRTLGLGIDDAAADNVVVVQRPERSELLLERSGVVRGRESDRRRERDCRHESDRRNRERRTRVERRHRRWH
jgi:hypothetical protein